MVKNAQNSFEGYINLFTFYIIPINYAIFMNKILIFETNWSWKYNCPPFFHPKKYLILIKISLFFSYENKIIFENLHVNNWNIKRHLIYIKIKLFLN